MKRAKRVESDKGRVSFTLRLICMRDTALFGEREKEILFRRRASTTERVLTKETRASNRKLQTQANVALPRDQSACDK